jgi:hypothetical protein
MGNVTPHHKHQTYYLKRREKGEIMTISARRYIYPPRATTAIPRDGLTILAQRGWIAQLKFNDTHIELDYDGSKINTIWDRHGKKPVYDFTRLQPDLDALGQKLVNSNHGEGRYLLDGGLLHSKHPAIKDTIVIWDILIKNDQYLLGTSYTERHHELDNLCTTERYKFQGLDLGTHITPRIFRPDNYLASAGDLTQWDKAWGIVNTINKDYEHPLLEGLICKDPRGRLKQGLVEKNNNDWMTRSRVTTGRHLF